MKTGRNRRKTPPGLGSNRRKKRTVGLCSEIGINKRSISDKRFGRNRRNNK